MSTRQRLQAVLARRRWLRWTLLSALALILVALAIVLVDALHRDPAPPREAPSSGQIININVGQREEGR